MAIAPNADNIMNDRSAGYDEFPRTAYLEHTLRRARNAAEQRSHRYVTLDHFLLALLDDPDAIKLLKAAGADLATIQATISNTVNGRLAALVDPTGRPPSFSYRFDTLFTGASEDAVRAGRKEIDGALALIGVAKDPESNASEILKANGFRLDLALRALGRGPEPELPNKPAPTLLPPAPQAGAAAPSTQGQIPKLSSQFPAPRPAQASQAGGGEILVEDMLATVRSILDGEERRDRVSLAAPPTLPPPIAPPSPRPSQPQRGPQLRADPPGTRNPAGVRPQAASRQERINPGGGPAALAGPPQAQPAFRAQPSLQSAGFAEAPAAAFDFEPPSAPRPSGKKRKGSTPKAARLSAEPAGPLARLLESVPRKARLAKGEMVQIRLSKEEAAHIFARDPRRPAQGGEAPPAYRAVTVRLSAPEGGFFIETAAPETQWLLGRQVAGGEEPFGTWSWAVVPNETGSYSLSLSISARDFDANGFPSEVRLPAQTIKIRVRSNFGRIFWGLFRSLLWLALGSGLTVSALYLLKALGKLPH